jgi:membrane-associated phospholipid phosphatase
LHAEGVIPPSISSPEKSQSALDAHVASPALVAWRTRHLVGILLVSALILVGLTLVASQADPNAIDLGATRWLQQFHNPVFATVMAWVSWPGFAPQTWVMPLAVAAPFALRRLWIEAVWVIATQASAPIAFGLKDLVHRARPSPELVGVRAPLDSPSFPSGHVVQYAVLFGFTFFLVYVLARRSTLRALVLVLLAVPIVLVGPSRLYLGQHWLSDVIGGYAVAAMVLVPLCWAYARWRLDATRRQFKS